MLSLENLKHSEALAQVDAVVVLSLKAPLRD
jgi:hypothetical protein